MAHRLGHLLHIIDRHAESTIHRSHRPPPWIKNTRPAGPPNRQVRKLGPIHPSVASHEPATT
jgi:hypothetical protein